MTLFSISQLGRFAGVKPHTIRAWESRYNALTPGRSDGNTRYYDSGQMKRLLNMVSLVKAGYRVSEVGGMTDERLSHLLEAVIEKRENATEEYFISQLISAGLTYDEARFEKTLAQCLLRYRLKNTYRYVLLPMLERIGLLWRCDKTSPAQEHFVSNLIRRKLFAAIEALPAADPGADQWLLLLPEHELHEIGLLMAYNLIRLAGHRAVYLGANVPLTALRATMQEMRPDRVLIFTLQYELSKPLQQFLCEMDCSFSGKRIYVGGNSFRMPDAPGYRRVEWLRTVEELTAALTVQG